MKLIEILIYILIGVLVLWAILKVLGIIESPAIIRNQNRIILGLERKGLGLC